LKRRRNAIYGGEGVLVREGEAAGTLGDLLLQKKKKNLPYCFLQTCTAEVNNAANLFVLMIHAYGIK
jgi:hypothetical protein